MQIMKIIKIAAFLIFLSFTPYICGQTDTYSVSVAGFSSNTNDEFSPVYYKNGLVFCSNRNWNLLRNYQTADNKGLLKINYVDTITNKVKLFSRNLSTRYNDGPASFSKNGDTIYFSRNLKVDGVAEQEISPRNKLGIFTATLEGNEWVKILDLRFNNEYYNITTPFISPDGKRLFFASDNPSGIGGTDIYYCNWKGDYWDEPVNLGPAVNTTGNESYPFVNSEGGLFFASDGHPGLGGKDIFYTKEVNGKWLPPVHLDPPVNSKYDDFGLIADSVMRNGYFSSKRGSSVDIFKFRTNINQLFYCDKQRVNQYCFKFTDEGKIQVDSRYVQLVWNFGDGETATGQNVEHCYKGPGKYPVRLDVTDKKTGEVYFSKLSYNLELRDIEQPVITSISSAMVGQPVNLDGLASHFPGSEILNYTWYFGDGSRAKGEKQSHVFLEKGDYDVKLGLMVRDTKTGVIRQACAIKPVRIFSDKNEKAAFDKRPPEPVVPVNVFEYDHIRTSGMYSAEKNLNPDMVYRLEIARSRRRLSPDEEILKTVPGKFNLKEEFIPDERIYSYTVMEEMNLMDLYPSYSELSGLGYSDARVITHLVTDPATKELLNLKRIFGTNTDAFFTANGSNLSSSGTQLLDLLLGFMSKYPALKLEIECHSDNQGTPSSSLALTQKRAEAMISYLVANGISGQRLRAKGIGGVRPIAPNYQESDRKRNRRIDFRIIENRPSSGSTN
jgi:outer membrane protein OmpA-like peptidoglycan-associated protein